VEVLKFVTELLVPLQPIEDLLAALVGALCSPLPTRMK
jgi:hypothetical protein